MGTNRPIISDYNKDIIFFDGVCNLCNGAVNFVIDRDEHKNFLFASLQSGIANELLSKSHVDPAQLDSIVLLTKDGQAYQKSDAAFGVLEKLKGPWKILLIFKFVPRFIRDAVYTWIATNRYKWFGKKDQCRIPSHDLTSRFIDSLPIT